jgi:hypothetical protein
MLPVRIPYILLKQLQERRTDVDQGNSMGEWIDDVDNHILIA